MRLYTYLMGPVEFDENRKDWRESITKKLEIMNITSFNPMIKSEWLDEDAKLNPGEYGEKLNKFVFNRESETIKPEITRCFKGLEKVRNYCLQMVYSSDFGICRLPDIKTAGTYEELSVFNNINKPVFFIAPDKKVPSWVYAMFTDVWYYAKTEDEVINKIKYIIDNPNLLKKEEKLKWLKLTYEERKIYK
jgi:hypothetical protein